MIRPDAPVRDLAGAYALDALSQEERTEFLAFLAHDEDARTEAVQLVDTAALLGAAVPAMTPPPALRARVLQLAEAHPAPVSARPSRPAAAPRPVAPLRPRRWVRRGVVPALAAAAAVAAIAAGGIAGATALQGGSPTGIERIQAASDVHTVREVVDGGGTAEVVWSPSERRAAVTLAHLPKLSGDRVYELWFIDRVGLATSAGVVPGRDADTARMLHGRLAHGDTIGVTIEPKGGSTAPTTPTILEVATA